MRNHILSITLFLVAFAASGGVSRQDGRIILSYDFSEDTVVQRAIGYGYFRHECRSVPTACGICSNSDSKAQCEVKVGAATPEALDAKLPTVSRLASGDQRDLCTGNDTNQECEDKISADAGAIGLSRGHCSVVDADNVTTDEWSVCEQRAAERGLVPGASVDILPHFSGSISFVHEKGGRSLQEAMNEGRRRLSMDAKAPVDLSDDGP